MSPSPLAYRESTAMRSFRADLSAYLQYHKAQEAKKTESEMHLTAGQQRLLGAVTVSKMRGRTDPAHDTTPSTASGVTRDGFFHMKRLREALAALDHAGWKRSYHQRQFHQDFLRACTRVFFKTEPPGSFERAHKRVLQLNGWDHLPQEILISTPRRFGKTISVSLFCAALLFACPAVECSIYSTCKRISQKMLRNICRFLDLIYVELRVQKFKVVRQNQEELIINGPEGMSDLRVINSYPSKVQPQPHTNPNKY